MIDKVHMVQIGTDKVDPERGIFRCTDCNAGSDKWLKHFMHKSSLRSLFMNAEGKKMDADLMRMVGQKIVERTREKHERAICDAMDQGQVGRSTDLADLRKRKEEPKESRKQTSERVVAKEGVKSGRAKKSWRTITVRRSRR